MSKMFVQGKDVAVITAEDRDYISLTDIAKYRNSENPADIVKNWLRSRSAIELLGLWEKLHNPDFKLVEFDQFKNEAGANYFVLSPQKWIETTNAIGLISKSGREGMAQKDRLVKLNAIAIQQMKILVEDHRVGKLEGGK